jgi:hypothetical protein
MVEREACCEWFASRFGAEALFRTPTLTLPRKREREGAMLPLVRAFYAFV